MHKYIYRGAVYIFNKLVTSDWYGETQAATPERAATNLHFQFTRAFGYVPNTKVRFSGEVERVG